MPLNAPRIILAPFAFVSMISMMMTAFSPRAGADNGMGRGGGDPYGLVFRVEGEQIAKLLDAWAATEAHPFGIDPREFREAIRTTGFKRLPKVFVNILPCDYHPEVAALPACQDPKSATQLRKTHKVEVSAANIPAEHMIEVSESRWPELSGNPDLLTAVVVHEYLGVMGGLDRYYDKSAAFFARLKAERNSADFKRELRTRLQGGVDAMLELFSPSLDEMKLTMGTIMTTSDYEKCVICPGRASEKERTDSCLSVARSMERVNKAIDFKQTDGYRKIVERERAAEQVLNSWIDALAIPERKAFALEQEYRVYGRANRLRAEIETFQHGLAQDLRYKCPGRVWDFLGCAMGYLRDVAERKLPERLAAARTDLKAEAERALADVDRYADGYSPSRPPSAAAPTTP